MPSPPNTLTPHPPSPRQVRYQQSRPVDGAARRPGPVVRPSLNYFALHWNGRLPLLVAIAASAALLWAVAQGLRLAQERFPLTVAPKLSAGLWLMEVAVLVLGVLWWGRGVQQSAIRHVDRGGSPLVALLAGVLGLGAFFWVGAFWWLSARHVAPDVWDTLTGDTSPAHVALLDPHIVQVQGNLEFGTTRALRGALEQAPQVRAVQLDSRGGRVLEGLALGRLLHERGLDTIVTAECSSACVTAFAGGTRRLIGPKARLGLHSAGGGGSTAAGVARANADSDAFMAGQGVDWRVLDKGAAVAHDDIWFPEHSVLLGAGLATERVP